MTGAREAMETEDRKTEKPSLALPMEAKWYLPFGLRVASALELPEFPRIPPALEADIALHIGPEAAEAVKETGEDRANSFDFVGLPDGAMVAHIHNVASILVRGGREIRMTPEHLEHGSSCESDGKPLMRIFAMGSAMGMALHQRELLVLHGATVIQDGHARVLLGERGAGKSTTAALLDRAGLAVFGDDIMPVFEAAGELSLRPGARAIKLCDDAVASLGIKPATLQPIGGQLGKRFLPLTTPGPKAAPLVEVIELMRDDSIEKPRLEPLSGLAALGAILAHTYRPEYLSLLGWQDRHFALAARIGSHVRVWRLWRPWNPEGAAATRDALLDHWENSKGSWQKKLA